MSNETTIGDWTFHTYYDHPFPANEGLPVYGYTTAADPKVHEWHPTIEHAMAAAIAEKYTGRRSAGGVGVDTAAGWFMRMIDADGWSVV